ncbi:MAG: DegT/DnrJ/EryC1/StrS family aminotransferase [Phycisphaerales bacterium]|nr:MAG: DegT/DnrJ/EryC1/StrS family aminotransferase [Phycisphaerales bacterium]
MSSDIPLSQPDITETEIEHVVRVLRSGRLSIGPMREEFESLVARRTGRQFGVSCSSGTAGLHMALLALGVGPGDEVVTTPFSFIASANCILYVNATPVFVDIDPRSLNMDPELVEQAITPRTKAIVAVETFGNPQHMDAYRAIAARHEIPLIEDCCEGLGGAWRGRPVGAFGRVGVFGFYPNKQITTGEGGMIVTDDDRLAETCRSLRNQGRAESTMTPAPGSSPAAGAWLRHERLGYNYRLSEVNAALGVAQMQRLDEIIKRRDEVAQRYMMRLMDHTDVILPTMHTDTVMSWFVFVVRLAHEYTQEERDRIIDGMRRHDVGASDYFPCIHLQPFYRERFGFRPGMFPIAESVSQRTIALPFYNALTERDQDMAVQTLELMISRENIKRT